MPLCFEAVEKRFGREAALAGVGLRLRRGERYGLVGHNGAGKSTLLRIALGLVRPDGGRVLVDGLDVWRRPREARARVGASLELPGFHGALDGRANLVVLARLQGLERAAARAEAERVLELVDLAHLGRKRVRAYSQGMRQRLALAQALLGAPPYLLLDEPTNGLDPEGIARVLALLRRLSEEGTGVLVSSHRLSELDGWCTRLAVLQRGRVLLEDEPQVLLARVSRGHELVAEPEARVRDVLAGLGVEAEATDEPNRLLLRAGTRALAAPAEIVGALVRAGCAVSSFAPRRARLEEALLDGNPAGLAHAPPLPAEVRSGPLTARRDVAEGLGADEDELSVPSAPRHGFLRVLAYELRRLARSRGARLAFLLPAVLGTAAVLRRSLELRLERASVERGELFGTTAVNAFEGLAVALQAGLPVLVWVAVGWASLSLAGELSRGTLASVVMRPLTRAEVGLGKLAGALVGALAALAVLLAASACVSALCFDFGDVVEILPNGKTYVHVEAAELVHPLPSVLLSPAVSLLALTTVGFLVGALLRSGTAALAASLAAVLGLELARAPARLFGREALLPTAHLPSPLGAGSSIDGYLDLCRGFNDAQLSSTLTAAVVALAWGAAAVLLALGAVSRRSLV